MQEWLAELDVAAPPAAEVFHAVLLPNLEVYGPDLGAPYFERIRSKSFFGISDFAEIRWHGRDRANYRIYCSIESGRKLVLYHAVTKRWQKFSNEDKAICRDRYNDYHSEAYDVANRTRLGT